MPENTADTACHADCAKPANRFHCADNQLVAVVQIETSHDQAARVAPVMAPVMLDQTLVAVPLVVLQVPDSQPVTAVQTETRNVRVAFTAVLIAFVMDDHTDEAVVLMVFQVAESHAVVDDQAETNQEIAERKNRTMASHNAWK